MAQQKLTKLEQSIKVNKDITIDLNTSYCNVVLDTWNKNSVQIEAYIEGEGVSNEALQEAIKSWQVDVDGSLNEVAINANGSSRKVWSNNSDDGDLITIVLDELKYELADLPDVIMENLDFNNEIPNLPKPPKAQAPMLPEAPELPALPEGMGAIDFDYEAYRKDGEKYMEKYTKQFESRFGKDFEKKMETWGESFGKKMEAWGKSIEENFNSKAFEDKMEAWGERFEHQMEQHAERREAHAERMNAIQEQAEARAEQIKNRKKLLEKRRVKIGEFIGDELDSKIKKTIIIKIPKDANLKVNVKYGELKLASNISNLEANLSHAKFKAYSISGSSTSINASYSPVAVKHWNLGELNLNYVDQAQLSDVKQLVLNSNASNIDIKNLSTSAVVNGSIGNLNIDKIDDDFNHLSIILENSDTVIRLPEVEYNLHYNGKATHFSHPEKTTDDASNSFSKTASNTNKTIVINAKYSHVTMKNSL
ncbi:hypothetical protein GCM10022291_34250 [Postechiella marina]|uniref:Adhesin domain-containing protein n=1 Tax=Postechiella marina TaxID=943941 RepID=A0ABP8CHW5_9FLAO